jgi:carbon monoxide dehydrogenase subunit G
MQLEQQFELPAAPEAAWPAFQDIELLVGCLPGASLTGPAVDGNWPLRFDVKLGPIAAAFAGSGRVSFDDTTRSGRFEGNAADKRTQSRVKGAADFSLAPGGAGTVVQVRVDYALTGSLAQFSRGGIVRELAGALTAQFAANLAHRLAPPAALVGAETGADSGATTAAGASVHASPAAATPGTARPLSAFGLLVQVLKARWQRWMRRLRQRAS